MRTFAILLMTFYALNLSAQKEVLIKSQYQPGKEYRQVTVSTIDGEMDLIGDPEMMEGLTASGMKLPIPIKTSTEMGFVIRVSEREADGRMPATMTFDKMVIAMQTMGVDQNIDNPVAGTVIKGWYNDDGKFTVDSAPDLGVEFSKEDLIKMIDQVQHSIDFPDRPLKVGETFTQRVPMNVPVASMSALKLFTETVYTVREIKRGKAILATEIGMTMDTTNDAQAATMAGKGSGTCIYDISETLIVGLDMNLDYTLSMNVQGMTMVIKMAGTTKQTTEIK